MDVKYFELRAANKQCVEKFTDLAKQKVDKVPIFAHACEYVNNSSSYKRNGRSLEIMDIRDYSIIVKLTSESKLEMASKSLAGFSRELLRIDQSMNPDADSRLSDTFHIIVHFSGIAKLISGRSIRMILLICQMLMHLRDALICFVTI